MLPLHVGGYNLTISGHGFGEDDMVMIGSVKCDVVEITYSQIICTVPPKVWNSNTPSHVWLSQTKRFSGNFSIRFWIQYVSLFTSIAAIVFLLLTKHFKIFCYVFLQLLHYPVPLLCLVGSNLRTAAD